MEGRMDRWTNCAIPWYETFVRCMKTVDCNVLTLKGPVPYIYTGPTSAANRGSTHLRRTRAELVLHSPRSWPALEPWLCPIAGRRKPRFNREVSELGLCQEPQAAFPVWALQFQATGLRYTSRKSCVHTFMPYSTCLIGNLPVFS